MSGPQRETHPAAMEPQQVQFDIWDGDFGVFPKWAAFRSSESGIQPRADLGNKCVSGLCKYTSCSRPGRCSGRVLLLTRPEFFSSHSLRPNKRRGGFGSINTRRRAAFETMAFLFSEAFSIPCTLLLTLKC